MQYEIEVNGNARQVAVQRVDGQFVVTVDGQEWMVDAARVGSHTWSLLIGGGTKSVEVTLVPGQTAGVMTARIGDTALNVVVNGRRRWGRVDDRGPSASTGPERVVAPMPGKIVRVLVKTGDAVAARQPVVVIEAMKMENELRASDAGTITELHARDGQSVEAGALLAVIHR